MNVGLRVTDNDGETATTTRTVTRPEHAAHRLLHGNAQPRLDRRPGQLRRLGSSDPEGTIAKYEWDLDGNGSYETSTGATPTAAKTYAKQRRRNGRPAGHRQRRRHHDDHCGLTVQNSAPTASFTASPNPVPDPQPGDLRRLRLRRPRRHHRQIRMGPRRQRQLRDDTGATATLRARSQAPAIASRPARHRRRRRHGDDHPHPDGPEPRPRASFTATPNPGRPARRSASTLPALSDPDGTIAKYEWDLDGNGSYETEHGRHGDREQAPTATAGNVTVGLRVTDNNGDTATTTRASPSRTALRRLLHGHAQPGPDRTAVSFDASGSADPDGTITKYEWDLDGNGSYETNTGATATTSKTYASASTPTIGLRVTDNDGATATTTRVLTVQNRLPLPPSRLRPTRS